MRMFLYLILLVFLSEILEGNLLAKDQGPLSGETLFNDVVYYSNLGHHRTATPIDRKTALWLQNRLKQAGFEVQKQEWTTRQFYPQRTEIVIDNKQTLEAFPIWWPKPTPPQGLEGLMTPVIGDSAGKIFFFENKTGAGFSVTPVFSKMIHEANQKGALAVIVVTYFNQPRTTIASKELIGLNALQTTQEEWPIPVVSARAKDRAVLDSAIQNQTVVKVISTGNYKNQARAFNVIGLLKKSSRDEVRVVSTPYSGWFTCAGERGPGIAIFLGLAEWAARTHSETNWIFVATSGHEIDGLGIRNFLVSPIAPDPKKTLSWVHLGAWQAMYNFIHTNGVLVSDGLMDTRQMQYENIPSRIKLEEPVKKNFTGLNVSFLPGIRLGELTGIIQSGYNQNLFGIAWGHELHHSTQDLPPVTGPGLLEPVAQAYRNTLEMLIHKP
ncbi:MAG: hypothetical protein AB1585_07070 [Thermodesulfobacteriota bacterium]